MAGDLSKSYSPHASETPVREAWDASDAFHADPDGPREPYSIVIPPPNVTAALHLGHAFNNTLQDVLVRVHRMRGHRTLWMPGTDHAGIATQTVVEKRLLQQGRKRTDFTRGQFVAKVQQWKDEYEAVIIEQLKLMGCSCDWKRVRFTMDPMCTRAVREAFYLLYRDGLIERGKRLVNWDPASGTALADDEVDMVEVDGQMWYLKYPLADGDGFVTVATTRPETMLGDTAVAMNPADPRAAGLVGRQVRLPIVNRLIPIIADDYVVMPGAPGAPGNPMAAFATGFLKVTPAHDPNDWEIGRRHDLAVINVLAPDATISRDHGWPREEFESGKARDAEPLLGLSREEAREQVVRWFRRNDLLQEVRNYRHSVGHGSRSHVPVEPYLSDQWFVRVTDDRLRGEALRAMDPAQRDGAPPPRSWTRKKARHGDGELRFFPPRFARTFQAWHENLRDWCISRQLWWGHRIPVWSRSLSPPPADGGFDGGDAAALAAWDRVRKEFKDRVAVAPLRDLEAAEKARARELARRAGCSIDAVIAALDQGALRVCVRGDGDGEAVAQLEAVGFQQDPDVLDTWFSSALWPISTMGWPRPADFPETRGLLEAFNPTSVLCTARDIITLWVSRMVMFNRYFRDGRLPFRDVYIHTTIQDGAGQRMSKSLGNGVDPRDIIRTHGADGLRFTLIQLASTTQDQRLPVDVVCPHCEQTFHPKEIVSSSGHRVAAAMQQCPSCDRKMVSGYGAAAGLATPTAEHPLALNTSSKFDQGRNFANKLWNAARFALGKLGHEGPAARRPGGQRRTLADRWILTRLHRSMHEVEDALTEYQFNVYAEAMYNLVWRDFCDWYLEAIKPTVAELPDQQRVLHTVLDAILRMLHPICPFVTETLWPHVRAVGEAGVDGIVLPRLDDGRPLALAAWPDISCRVDDDEAALVFGRLQALVSAIRNLRSEHQVPPRRRIMLHAPPDLVELVAQGDGAVETLAGLAHVAPYTDGGAPPGAIPLALEGAQLWLSDLVESLDAGAERERLRKVRHEKEKERDGLRKRLGNESYRVKAPPHLVAQTEDQLARAEADLAAAERALAVLEGAS